MSELKFTLTPTKRINRGSRKPKPIKSTQRPYRRPKPRVIAKHYEHYFRGAVKLETLSKIRQKIIKIEIRQTFNNTIVRVWFADGSFIML